MNISLNFFSRSRCACQSYSALEGAPSMPRAGLMSPHTTDLDELWDGYDYPFSTGSPGFGTGRGVGAPMVCGPNLWSCELTGQQWSQGAPSGHGGQPSSTSAFPTPPSGTGSPAKARAVAPKGTSRPGKRVNIRPLAQSNSVSCGQTSVAMSINALTGKKLTDRDIDGRYGFSLLQALNSESRGSGFSWKDGGDMTRDKWSILEQKINKKGTPVLIGLNGPTFSPSGRGHIVTLIGIDGNKVTYADPADGKVKTTTRQAIEQAPPHPDGKFLFYVS